MELKVSLTSKVNPDVIVPFLITPDSLNHPILGTNAITLLTKHVTNHKLLSAFQEALPDRNHDKVTQLVNLIQAEKDLSVSFVKTTKQKIRIPANNNVSLNCCMEGNCLDQSIPVAIETVSSDIHQDPSCYVINFNTSTKRDNIINENCNHQ